MSLFDRQGRVCISGVLGLTSLHKGNGIGHTENVQGTHFEYRRFVRHAIAVSIDVVAYHFSGLQTEMIAFCTSPPAPPMPRVGGRVDCLAIA